MSSVYCSKADASRPLNGAPSVPCSSIIRSGTSATNLGYSAMTSCHTWRSTANTWIIFRLESKTHLVQCIVCAVRVPAAV